MNSKLKTFNPLFLFILIIASLLILHYYLTSLIISREYITDGNLNLSFANYDSKLLVKISDNEFRFMLPKSNEYYALLLLENNNQSEVYINNKRITKNKDFIIFYAEEESFLIKIDNYNINGNNNPIYLGSIEAVQKYLFFKLIYSFFYVLLFALTSLYYICLILNKTNQQRFISFAILCVAFSFKALINYDKLFFIFFPTASINIYNYLKLISSPIVMICLLHHINSLYYKYIHKLASFIISFAFIIYMIIFIFVQNQTLIQYVSYNIILFACISTIIISILQAITSGESSAIINLFGILIITAACIVDIIFIYKVSISHILPAYALYIFIKIDLFIRENSSVYQNESTILKNYSLAISEIKKEETNYLSSHLKAHFLFNALNIISGYSLFEPQKAKDITNALIIYLKQLFEHDNLNEMNSLENEIALLKAFAYIETERFPNLNIYYNIPNDLPNLLMPSLTLQPLLENAINHGIRKKSSKSIGNIVISIRQFKEYIYFSIKDDGIGQNEELIQTSLNINSNGKFHTLYHIQNRLNTLYNENIKIRSISNIGTFISFRIPLN